VDSADAPGPEAPVAFTFLHDDTVGVCDLDGNCC
jgi:hypothetical protein